MARLPLKLIAGALARRDDEASPGLGSAAKLALLGAMALPLLMACAVSFSLAASYTGASSGSGARIVEVALQEYGEYADNGIVGGSKYQQWLFGGADEPWCAAFVSWCADQCGMLEGGTVPKSGSVAEFLEYYRSDPSKGKVYPASSYAPQPGDFAVWQKSEVEASLYDSHIAIVEKTDGSGTVRTIEGNCGDAVMKMAYADASGIAYFVHPAYPSSPGMGGEEIEVPEGLGSVHTYMGWQTITSPSSTQYRLREEAGQAFDEEGFACIDGRYVVACTTTFGDVGDLVDFVQDDGLVLECVIGDIKSQGDAGCNKWGHLDGACIVEFVVDRASWYGTGHANPGTPGCRPEWGRDIVRAVNRGSWFGGDGNPAGTGLAGCSALLPTAGSATGEDYAGATPAQKRMADAALAGSMYGCVTGQCEAWVERCFEAAGGSYPHMCCASGGFAAWGSTAERSGIPVGACVYGWSNPFAGGGCHADFGHVAVYVGGENVVSNEGGKPIERSVEDWISVFGWQGWGWCGGVDLSEEG